MRWLHLSDIHMNVEYNLMHSELLRDELLAFIKEQDFGVDYLFITGDYRDAAYMQYAGLSEDLHEQAANVARYIQNLAEALDLPLERVYLVPGNHDLTRQPEDIDLVREVRACYHTCTENIDALKRDALLKRFDFFEAIEQALHPGCAAIRWADHRYYQETQVDLLCLNTALTCTGEKEDGNLILDAHSVYQLTKAKERQVPLIVLAHHELTFLTEDEVENLKTILNNRQVFYLCGHQHQLKYTVSEAGKLTEMRVGAIKKDTWAAAVFAFGEISAQGSSSSFKCYQFDFNTQIGWEFQSLFGSQAHSYKLGFVGESNNADPEPGFEIISLPLNHTMDSTKGKRKETIDILTKLKGNMGGLGHKKQLLIAQTALPVNAGLIIGYVLHKNQNIQLAFQYNNVIYNHIYGQEVIPFDRKIINESAQIQGQKVDLCVYIQAKQMNDGQIFFERYVQTHKLQNPIKLTLTNVGRYDNHFDLEASAQYLANEINNCREALLKQGAENVGVHLFYNGFWGLALFLGNQLPMLFPIQLYDYCSTKQQYSKSFKLDADMF